MQFFTDRFQRKDVRKEIMNLCEKQYFYSYKNAMLVIPDSDPGSAIRRKSTLPHSP